MRLQATTKKEIQHTSIRNDLTVQHETTKIFFFIFYRETNIPREEINEISQFFFISCCFLYYTKHLLLFFCPFYFLVFENKTN